MLQPANRSFLCVLSFSAIVYRVRSVGGSTKRKDRGESAVEPNDESLYIPWPNGTAPRESLLVVKSSEYFKTDKRPHVGRGGAG